MSVDQLGAGRNGRVPPSDYTAEQSVLGACMIDSSAYVQAARFVNGESWYWRKHGLIWSAIEREATEEGLADLVRVSGRLRADGVLEEVGGDLYLGELAEGCPFPGNVDHYAEQVRDRAMLRAAVGAGHEIIERAHAADARAGDVLSGAASRVERALASLAREPVSASAAIEATVGEIEARARGEHAPSIRPPYEELEELTGWWSAGDLVVVGGETSVGKSALLHDAGRRLAESGVHVLVWSGEMTREQIFQRLASGHAHQHQGVELPYSRMRAGRRFIGEHRGEIQQAFSSLDKAVRNRIVVNDEFDASLEEIVRSWSVWRLRHPDERAIAVLDYLQLLPDPDQYTRDRRAIGVHMKALKRRARELRMPILVASQLNREADARLAEGHEPELRDLFGASEIEKTSDFVVMLHRPKRAKPGDAEEPADVERKLLAKKVRHGPRGRCAMIWAGAYGRLVSRADRPPVSEPAPAEPRLPYKDDDDPF